MTQTEPARVDSPDPAAPTGWKAFVRSDRVLKFFAWGAVVANGGIGVTGATVRVTGSGLGCETWPACQPGTLVPEYREGLDGIHEAIEFGNRTLTGLVLVFSLGTFLLLLLRTPRRPDVLRLAAWGPIGVLFQAIWGGVIVHNELAWWTVAPHMLVSLVLVGYALATVARIHEPNVPAQPTVPAPLRRLAQGTVGVLAALCIVGTLVTAAGPHAGDVDTPRLELSVESLAQAHADLMFLYFGLVVAMMVAFAAVKAPRRLMRRGWVLLGITAAQGLLGLVQYAIGVPELLVVLHVLGAVSVVVAGVWMVLATRERALAVDGSPPG